jgi:uroporphyrin-3 C-methyltransferase
MSSESAANESVPESAGLPAATAAPVPAAAAGITVPRPLAAAVVVLAALALLVGGLLWQKLGHIQEELARRSADSGAQAVEARTLAKEAQDLATETAARQALTETRLSEVALQRTQLEELMQSLSRSRDENLVVDIESSLRLAQQQAQLTGSVEPLLAALKTADQRVARAAQPRLTPLQRAIARDVDRVKAASVTDTPGLLIKLDELVRQVDELPLLNAVGVNGAAAAARSAKPAPAAPEPRWWQRSLALVLDEARGLVRVSRIEQPDAVLLSPEQSFFLRENLKLKLLNARLGLLARQLDSSRADLASAGAALGKYFDPASRKTQATAALLQQVQQQMKAVELPRVDDTLAALATAAAGR